MLNFKTGETDFTRRLRNAEEEVSHIKELIKLLTLGESV